MNEWNIQTRAHHCQACGNGFEDKAAYHTLLLADPEEGYVRRDICASCWKSEFAEGRDPGEGHISYWQGVYESPPPPPPEPIQKENAESLLRKIIELNNPTFAATGYILAVMLERKRQLKIKEQINQDGQRVFIYEHPKSGDLFTIIDPALQLSQLESVQIQVADLLEFGLNDQGDIAYPPAEENTGVLSTEGSFDEAVSDAEATNVDPLEHPDPIASSALGEPSLETAIEVMTEEEDDLDSAEEDDEEFDDDDDDDDDGDDDGDDDDDDEEEDWDEEPVSQSESTSEETPRPR